MHEQQQQLSCMSNSNKSTAAAAAKDKWHASSDESQETRESSATLPAVQMTSINQAGKLCFCRAAVCNAPDPEPKPI